MECSSEIDARSTTTNLSVIGSAEVCSSVVIFGGNTTLISRYEGPQYLHRAHITDTNGMPLLWADVQEGITVARSRAGVGAFMSIGLVAAQAPDLVISPAIHFTPLSRTTLPAVVDVRPHTVLAGVDTTLLVSVQRY